MSKAFVTHIRRILGSILYRLGLLYQVRRGLMPFKKRLGWRIIPSLDGGGSSDQLYRIARRSKPVLAEMERLSGLGPTILFPQMRGGDYHIAFQTFLAQRLRFEGAQPIFMACQDLPMCQVRSVSRPTNPDICKGCLKTLRFYAEQMNLPLYKLKDLVKRDIYEKAYEMTRSLSLDQCFRYQYRSVPIGELCEVSVTRYLCRDVQECDSPEALQIWRDFLTGAIVLVDAYEEAFSRFRPDILFLCNGRLFWYSVAHWMARRRGIRVVSYEKAYGTHVTGKYWTFREEIPVAEMDVGYLWHTWQNIPLSKDEDSQLDRVVQMRTHNPVMYPNPIENHRIMLNELGLPDNKPVVAMFTNLTWDSAVSGMRTIFKSVLEWTRETLRFANQKGDFNLVIRVHPAEALVLDGERTREHVIDDLYREFRDLPDNVRIIPPESQLSSYTLLDLAKVVLVYTGTIGLEASVRGHCPVVICGNAHYANKGFGLFPQSREEYFELLGNLDQILPPSEQQVALARRYACLFWFRTAIPLQFYEIYEKWLISRFTIGSFEELRPGRDPYLDLIADGILGRGEFVLPWEMGGVVEIA